MNATIDKFGRVVIPKELRDECGLRPGSPVSISVQGGAIVLSVQDEASPLARDEQALVYTGRALADLDAHMTQQRAARLMGLASR